MKVGDPWDWKPTAFTCVSKIKGASVAPGEDFDPIVRGYIAWINAEHHYFLAEAHVNGYVLRECFKYRGALCRKSKASAINATGGTPGCQDKCEDYLAWKAACDAEKAKIKEEKKKYEDVRSYQCGTAKRLRRLK